MKYKLQVRPQGITAWQNYTAPASARSYTVINLIPGTTYQWRIATLCQNSRQVISTNSIANTFKSIPNLIAKQQVQIAENGRNEFTYILSPNLATSSAMLIVNPISRNLKVTLTDLQGKQLWQGPKITGKNIAVPLSKLTSGIYLVMINDDYNSKTVRLLRLLKMQKKVASVRGCNLFNRTHW